MIFGIVYFVSAFLHITLFHVLAKIYKEDFSGPMLFGFFGPIGPVIIGLVFACYLLFFVLPKKTSDFIYRKFFLKEAKVPKNSINHESTIRLLTEELNKTKQELVGYKNYRGE